MPDNAPLMREQDLSDEDRKILAAIADRKGKQKQTTSALTSGRFVEVPDTETEEQRFKRIMETPGAWDR